MNHGYGLDVAISILRNDALLDKFVQDLIGLSIVLEFRLEGLILHLEVLHRLDLLLQGLLLGKGLRLLVLDLLLGPSAF